MEWWVRGRAIEGMMLTATEESNGNRPSSNNVRLKEAKPIEIDGRDIIWSVAFLANGKHVVSGGKEGKIRCWQIEDGKEAGAPMDAGAPVIDIAVSHDGKWLVSGTDSGEMTVWNAEHHSKVTGFQGHRN
jgi:WD40 repeat protein